MARVVAPVFLVGAPFAGNATLLASLALASGVWMPRDEGEQLLDQLAEDPSARPAATDALVAALVDREGRGAEQAEGPVRPVLAEDRLALRIAPLAALFPDARFVLVVREPADAIADALADGTERTAAELAERWRASTEAALDALEALAPDRWRAVDLANLLADPREELRRLCDFLDLPYDQALLSPFEELRRWRAARSAPVPPALTEALPRIAAAAARARALTASTAPPVLPAPPPAPEVALGSQFTGSFPQALTALGSTLLVSTYQTGNSSACARATAR